MKKWFNSVAIALTLVLGSYAMAVDATAKPTHGKVTAVAPDSADAKITDITIAPHAKKGEATPDPIIVKADAGTTVTKDKAAATLADVTVGTYINVTLGDGNKATAIDIHTPKKKPATSSK